MIERIFKILSRYGSVFLEGAWGTIWISFIVVLFGTLLGGLLALGKMNKNKILNSFINLYVEVIRGTPILLQLYFFTYGVSQFIPIDLSDVVWVIMALIINSSAYVAEVFRSGINAVNKGQFEAAESLGLSHSNMMRKIILPQAIKNILPALGNEFVTMIKETSLASIFFITSLMTAESIVSGRTSLKIESLIIVGAIYLMMTFPLSKLVQHYERKFAKND